MKIRFLIIFLWIGLVSNAQNGTITGTITDKEMNNEPLPFGNAVIKGTTTGVTTDEFGKYSISIAPGNYILQLSFVGYETVEENVTVVAGETVVVDRALGSGGYTLEDVVIQTQQNRERETALLLDQKNAIEIKQAIGAQEMSRKGVSDAEGAVTKITGVSKQEGEKNVFVRGLGDRYNSTTMNGMPLPSEDPEYKNIALDFFTSDVIKSIGVNKTFGSEIYGDVGGANIDILSKEMTGNSGIEIGISSGFNSQAIGKKNFLTMDGGNWFGTVRNPNSGITDLNRYSFRNSLDPGTQSVQLNSSLTASAGRKFEFGGGDLSMYIVGNISNGFSYREGNIKQTTSIGTVFQDQDFEKYVYNVSQTLMGNFKYRFSNRNTLALNTLYIHDNTQDVSEYEGMNDPQEDGDLEFLRRQQQNNNRLFVTQLLSEIRFSDRLKLDLGGAFNNVSGNEPDRRSNVFLYRFGNYIPSTNSAGENERYFSELNENDFAAKAVMSYSLSKDQSTKSKIDFGYNFRNTQREFDAIIYNHRFLPPYLPEVDIHNVDAIFNQQQLDNNVFELQTGNGTAASPTVFDPFFYNGDRTIHAGLGSITYEFSPKFTAVAGARFEKILQEVAYDTNIASSLTNGISKIDKTYLLPNFNLKYNLTDNSILRAAGSMSYTMPQFKEVAPFKYQDVSFSSQGNPELVPSENLNADLKWEYYPKSDEIIAVTGFYKVIKNPIARSEIPSGGNTLTYLNVGGEARVFGVELEVRKNLFKTAAENENQTVLAMGANVSYLNSEQQLENTLPQFTNSADELQGASPLLANADLTFQKSTGTYSVTSSVVFNYFSDRIFSIGTRGFENVVEKGVPTLDFVTQSTLGKNFGISLKVKNLLNPDFTLTRESNGAADAVTLSEYKRGIDVSLGLSYKF